MKTKRSKSQTKTDSQTPKSRRHSGFQDKKRKPTTPHLTAEKSFAFKSSEEVFYDPHAINLSEKTEIIKYLNSLYPIWEKRYSEAEANNNPEKDRQLLRPVYWLGNWQFACLNYYHPPEGIEHRCVRAEDFPQILTKISARAENLVHSLFRESDIPKSWKLNTCLINFYGDRILDGKRHDGGRVGEHKDFEPGPIASLSIGERALFQFVQSMGKQGSSKVMQEQWLDDGSLLIFGGHRLKNKLFHRVQRVDRKNQWALRYEHLQDFETRRVNFTFRYVPDKHVYSLNELPLDKRECIDEYVKLLAKHRTFWKEEMDSLSQTE